MQREVVVLQATTARGLKHRPTMLSCLARLTKELGNLLAQHRQLQEQQQQQQQQQQQRHLEHQQQEQDQEQAQEAQSLSEHHLLIGASSKRAPAKKRGRPPSRPPLMTTAEVEKAASATTSTAPEGEGERGREEQAARRGGGGGGGGEEVLRSVDPETTELEMFLEYGLLCREVGRQEDSTSVILALVELAVFQSKSDFRRSRKNKGVVEEEEKEEEENEAREREKEGEERKEGVEGGTGGGTDRFLKNNRAAVPVATSTATAPAVPLPEQDGPTITAATTATITSPLPARNPHQMDIPLLLPRTWDVTPFQSALHKHLHLHFARTEIVSLLGEPKLFLAARSLIRACIDTHGMIKEAGSLTRTLVQRKHLLTEDHARELHEYTLLHAVNDDDYSSAIKSSIVSLSSHPTSLERGNALNRLVRKASRADANRAVIRRMAHKTPHSLPLALLSGNAFAISRNYQMALDKFLGAYRLAPTEPLITLAAGALLMRVLSHRKLVDRHGCLVKCLGFLERYAQLRREQGVEEEVLREEGREGGVAPAVAVAAAGKAMEQEVVFNMGRAFHQAGLLHMAVPFYQDALKMFDAHEEEWRRGVGDKGHVTREAAWNLVVIYMGSNNRELARGVAERYLRV